MNRLDWDVEFHARGETDDGVRSCMKGCHDGVLSTYHCLCAPEAMGWRRVKIG